MNNIKATVKDLITIDRKEGFIITGQDNLTTLKQLPDGCVDAIYIDPPYMTNKTWKKNDWSFDDKFDSIWEFLFFLGERLVEAKRIMRTSQFQLKDDILYRDNIEETYKPLIDKVMSDHSGKGKRKKLLKGITIGSSIFVHIDYRTNSEIKTYLMDPLFGEDNTALKWNEIQALFKIKLGKKIHEPISVPKVDITAGPSICMDFFAGAHSYAAAAHKLGRRYISIEMNKTEELFNKQIDGVEFGELRTD